MVHVNEQLVKYLNINMSQFYCTLKWGLPQSCMSNEIPSNSIFIFAGETEFLNGWTHS